MQVINSNLNSLMSRNALAVHSQSTEQSSERLSSGKRINKAADDAAGLAISERMTSDVRGARQGIRNAIDGVSLLKTAEGALGQTVSMLHRIRELTIQAGNGINTVENVAILQSEVDQISQGIKDLLSGTRFNGKRVLQDPSELSGRGELEFYLKNVWIPESEALIRDHFGLNARGISIDLNYYTDGPFNTLASVGSVFNTGFGGSTSLTLNIDTADFPATGYPSGDGPIKQDRVIAHEMVHAVMAANMDLGALPGWFTEGTAELIHGADKRVFDDTNKGSTAGIAALVTSANLKTSPGSPAGPTASLGYSLGYVATKMLEEEATGGVKAIMKDLAQGVSFDQAIQNNSSYTQATFEAFVLSDGVNFINTEMDLRDADTGSIDGSDYGKTAKNDLDVISNGLVKTESTDLVLTGLTADANERVLGLQLGDSKSSRISFERIFVNPEGISAADVDLRDTEEALEKVDLAIDKVGSYQGQLGALQNRLQHSVNNLAVFQEQTAAARSRIEDADFAAESAELSRSQVLTQAAQAMLAQSNSRPQQVLALLQ